MNGQQLLDTFHLYTGDQSEMSSADELSLANNILQDIYAERPWEFLKKSATGTITVSAGVASITLPADFASLIENAEKTDNTQTIDNNAVAKVVYVGTNYTPYQIVNWSDRRQVRTSSGYAYLDIVNNKIVFTTVPTELTYEFDYIYNPADITLSTSPIMPSRFHQLIPQLMAIDSVIINLFDRTHSYAKENAAGAEEMLSKMRLWNANLIAN